MNHSGTPKGAHKSGRPNYKRMKRRLQLKVRVDEPDVREDLEDQDVLVEEPLGSAQPHKQDDQAVDDDDSGTEKPMAQSKNQSNFNRASPMRMVRVCKGMVPAQWDLIVKADFGDILRMKCSKLIPDLCRFLMEHFNPTLCCLDFGARGKIPVTTESVCKVMGVPMGSIPVPYHRDVHATGLIMEMLGVEKGRQPTITSVEKGLGPGQPADELYLSKFVVYMMSSVFAPTTGIRISPKCYPSAVNPKAINRLNWAKFIIDILLQTANQKEKKNWFKACMPYLMIRYVDSLETDALVVPEDGTRICVWTNKMIKLISDLDKNSDGSFGKLPLKACFRNNFSLFSSDPASVDMFIKCHVPGIQDEETLAKYRVPVIEMCSVFEDGLAKFLISLSDKDAKATLPQHNLQVNEHKDMPKRRRVRCRSDPNVHANAKDQPILGMPIDEDKVTSETATHKTMTNKRKPSDDWMGGGRVGKKIQAEPEREGVQDEKTHGIAVQSMGEEMTAPNNQVPVITPEHVTGASILKEAVCEPAQPSDEDAMGIHKSCIDPLKLLQCYGSGSQSSAETIGEVAPPSNVAPTASHINMEQVQGGSSCETPLIRKNAGKSKKSVTFADDVNNSSVKIRKTVQNEEMESSNNASLEIKATSVSHLANESLQGSPTGRRPVTRSMSPSKLAAPSYKEIIGQNVMASSIPNDSMSRKLELDFEKTEAEYQRRRREIIEDCPSFELGLDEQVSQETTGQKESEEPANNPKELVVISSNEDSGDSLDKIFATIEMPTRTPVSEKKDVSEEGIVTPLGPNSYTPIPQAHQKRIVKPTNAQKSPFVDVDQKAVSTKFTNEVYSRVCEYGGKTENELNKEKIIDYGHFFIYLSDLADSVRPGAWLSNHTCELALHVLSIEMEKERKHVMPLRLATKLRSPTCILDRYVKKMFKATPECRLDHKDQVMFAVLQDLTPDIEQFNGHYYLIVLNLKAERFEVMDSLRGKGNKGLMTDYRSIVASIKYMWGLNYADSKIDIQNWKTEHIETPKQKTSFDCGYFMLKFIELWTGRKMLTLNPSDMPNIRKLFLKKWLEHAENKTEWQKLLIRPNPL